MRTLGGRATSSVSNFQMTRCGSLEKAQSSASRVAAGSVSERIMEPSEKKMTPCSASSIHSCSSASSSPSGACERGAR